MKTITRSVLTAVSVLLLALPALADHLSAKFLFAARLDGAQETPAVTTNAVGVASFYLSERRDTLCIMGTFNGLSGPITNIHIHEAPPGVPGGVVVDLKPFLNQNGLSATLTGATLASLNMSKLFSGLYYINVHTAANTGGEIRGQILPEEDKGFLVRMDGAQERPNPVATPGRGLASVVLSKHLKRLSFYLVFDSLTSPITNAHFHRGPDSVAGPVVQGILSFANGNVIAGSVDPTAWLSALLADSIYINIHTQNNPGGEIRGQLRVQPYLHFDARMDGSQEAPNPVVTNARGLTVLQMNYAMDSLWYEVLATGLSGPATNGHLHKGAFGVGGGVVVPFTGIAGNRISGVANLTTLADSIKRMLWEGNLYSNIHTAANAPGEIRGQVYRTFREGYTYPITGDGETPPISVQSYGSGMVSIDRDQTNAHYMAAVTGLTPTAAHFHIGPAGVPGPVAYNLGATLVNNGAFGYWMDTGTTGAFSADTSRLFRRDSIYINFHTTAHASGEIRGNVTRTLCKTFTIPAGVANLGGTSAVVRIYPNPAGESATMQVVLSGKLDAAITVTDVMGRVVLRREAALLPGSNYVTLPLGGLAAGLYLVRLAADGGSLSYKLIRE